MNEGRGGRPATELHEHTQRQPHHLICTVKNCLSQNRLLMGARFGAIAAAQPAAMTALARGVVLPVSGH